MKCESDSNRVDFHFLYITFYNFRSLGEISSRNDSELLNQQIGVTREPEAVEIGHSLCGKNSPDLAKVNEQTPNKL